MIKSVWLSNLIVSSLNDGGSILFSYFRHLRTLIGAGDCSMCLVEPEQSGETWFLISSHRACAVPLPDPRIDGETVRAVIAGKAPRLCGRMLYCPLACEDTAAFGALVFEVGEDYTEPEKLGETLLAFATVLYSESMGSIVHSFHDTVMQARDVCVDYPHGKSVQRVVNRVNLEIYEKEFTVIVGASGSGKTSLLNVLGGMLQASEGTVLWRGTAVTDMTEKQRTAYRRNTVGFVFQRYNLINDLTAEENVGIAASLVKDPLPIGEVLEMVGLKDKAKSYPAQLSGGEQQRVCIARALVKRSDLLLCDEPTGALDTGNAQQIIRILKRIAKEQGIPVVVITHNPKLVVLADHCVTISNGTVASDLLQPFALSADDLIL